MYEILLIWLYCVILWCGALIIMRGRLAGTRTASTKNEKTTDLIIQPFEIKMQYKPDDSWIDQIINNAGTDPNEILATSKAVIESIDEDLNAKSYPFNGGHSPTYRVTKHHKGCDCGQCGISTKALEQRRSMLNDFIDSLESEIIAAKYVKEMSYVQTT